MPRIQKTLAVAIILLAALFAGYVPSFAGSVDARIQRLLAESLGQGSDQSYWLTNTKDPKHATEALGIVYLPIEGSAGSATMQVGYFVRSGSGFKLAGRVRELFGYDPRNVRFLRGRIELITTMPKPGEPRCCPTGTARWEIDRRSLVARRLR